MAIAEHSMCHPGRPRPQGVSQAAPTSSSSGRTAFQSTKSRTSSRSYSSAATRSPRRPAETSTFESLPYPANSEMS